MQASNTGSRIHRWAVAIVLAATLATSAVTMAQFSALTASLAIHESNNIALVAATYNIAEAGNADARKAVDSWIAAEKKTLPYGHAFQLNRLLHVLFGAASLVLLLALLFMIPASWRRPDAGRGGDRGLEIATPTDEGVVWRQAG